MPAEQAQSLAEELHHEIAHHKKWENRDFTCAQVLVWTGIITSVAAALHGAEAYSLSKFWGAVVASVPGAVLIIDRTFKFGARASWHALYRVSLKALNRKLHVEEASPAIVAAELSKLEFDMERMFPPLDAGVLGTKNH